MKKQLIIIISFLIFLGLLGVGLNNEIVQAAPGYINVYTPTSSDMWFKGGSYSIYWNSENAGNYVIIELYNNGIYYSTITSSTYNDNWHSWFISSSIPSSTNYQIKITLFFYL